MAFAPVIGTAFSVIGTVAGLASQRRQERRQQSQVDAGRAAGRNQMRIAEAQFNIEQQRFEYSKNASEQYFLKESMVAQQQARMAREQLEQARIQEEFRIMQAEAQREQTGAQFAQQVAGLLTAGAGAEQQGFIQSEQQLRQLMDALGQNNLGRAALQRRLSRVLDRSSLQTNALENEAITNYQMGMRGSNDATRAGEIQATNLANQASLTEDYGALVDRYMGTINDINAQMNASMLELQPQLLALQEQANQKALESAKYSNAANMNIGQMSSLFNYQNNMATANAMMPMMPQSNFAASLFGALGQTVPQVVSGINALNQMYNVPTQPQPTYSSNLPNAPAPPVDPWYYTLG